jgi:hypothetical protein
MVADIIVIRNDMSLDDPESQHTDGQQSCNGLKGDVENMHIELIP